MKDLKLKFWKSRNKTIEQSLYLDSTKDLWLGSKGMNTGEAGTRCRLGGLSEHTRPSLHCCLAGKRSDFPVCHTLLEGLSKRNRVLGPVLRVSNSGGLGGT